MSKDWRVWRPAIWLAILGIAVMLLMTTPWVGIVICGGSIGIAARIAQRQRRVHRSSR